MSGLCEHGTLSGRWSIGHGMIRIGIKVVPGWVVLGLVMRARSEHERARTAKTTCKGLLCYNARVAQA